MTTPGGQAHFGWVERDQLLTLGLAVDVPVHRHGTTDEHGNNVCDDWELRLDLDALVAYKPPQNSDDKLVNGDRFARALDGPVAFFTGRQAATCCAIFNSTWPNLRTGSSSRLELGAAAWLWQARQEHERYGAKTGITTPNAWCTACGRHFLAAVRINPGTGRGPKRSIGKWCDRCEDRGVRNEPQRLCAAPDCDRWFTRADKRQNYCEPACAEAARRRRVA